MENFIKISNKEIASNFMNTYKTLFFQNNSNNLNNNKNNNNQSNYINYYNKENNNIINLNNNLVKNNNINNNKKTLDEDENFEISNEMINDAFGDIVKENSILNENENSDKEKIQINNNSIIQLKKLLKNKSKKNEYSIYNNKLIPKKLPELIPIFEPSKFIINSKELKEVNLLNYFNFIYKQKNPQINNNEIQSIIEKINNSNIDQNSPTFKGPYLIGSYKFFSIDQLNYIEPNIDILFTCEKIYKLIKHDNSIFESLINNSLIDLLNLMGKTNIIEDNRINGFRKYECEIKNLKYNLKINFYFIDITKKYNLKIIDNILFTKLPFNKFNNNKVILSIIFRKFRKKYNLNFIYSEIFDEIIENNYKEQNITLFFQQILYKLYNKNIIFENNNNRKFLIINKILKENVYNNEIKFKILQNSIIDFEQYLINDKFNDLL